MPIREGATPRGQEMMPHQRMWYLLVVMLALASWGG
jgi:hypothetical protein